jgi:hypothetical protein
MCDFIWSGLGAIHLLSHLTALGTVAILLTLWTVASLLACLLIGRAFYLFGDGQDHPEEIIEAPPEEDSHLVVCCPSRQDAKSRCSTVGGRPSNPPPATR